MGAARAVAACAAVALLMLVPASTVHANHEAQLLLDRAIQSIDTGDADGYEQAVTAIESSEFWFPDTLAGALAEQNVDHIIAVWFLIGAPDLETVQMARDTASFERDGIRFGDLDDPFGQEMLDSVDLDGFAALQTLEHRGFVTTPAIEMALQLLPADGARHPDTATYDAAISDLTALLSSTPVAGPDDSTDSDLAIEPAAVPSLAANEPVTPADPTTPVASPGVDPGADDRSTDLDTLSENTEAATPTPSETTPETTTVPAAASEQLGLRAAIPWIAVGGISVATVLLGLLALRRSREAAGLAGLAHTDGLTGLHNRRKFDDDIDMHRLQGDRPVAMLMIDVDKFKSFNDVHGHAIGDEVLRLVGAALAHTIRRHDVAYRYGGEEFCALLPGTFPDEAHHVAERIRAAIEAIVLPVNATLTASVGLASGRSSDVDVLVADADTALYSAKANGRNRVVCAA